TYRSLGSLPTEALPDPARSRPVPGPNPRIRWSRWEDVSVRFHTEHTFTGSEQGGAGLLSDPAFSLELTLPDLGQPEVLEQRQDAAASSLRLRYEFIGSIDPIARRLIGSDRLSWIQEVRVDRSAGSGALGFQAEKSPKQLHGAATFTLVPTDGGCVRSL